jgi:hypothetical protein
MLAQVLRIAQVKSQELLQAVPENRPDLERSAQYLQQELVAVLRQALALQQQALLPMEPLLEGPFEPQVFHLLESEVTRQLNQLVEKSLAGAKALVEAEAQVEVLEPELVEVQLPVEFEEGK